MNRVKFISLTASLVLAMVFTLSCSDDESAFVGKWTRNDGYRSMELFKDGTGLARKGDDSGPLSWKLVENKRFVISSPGFSQAWDYKISDKKLTLIDDKGENEIYVHPQEEKIEGKTLTDNRDGKKYKTVTIGTQIWMAENLNYEAKGSKCYDNDSSNCQKYGRLYDWNTAKEACPSGWHLPSKEEWTIDGYVGGETAGKKLKSKSGWNGDGNGTDNYGFSAPPGGYGRSDDSFDSFGIGGYWWSSASELNSDDAYYRSIGYDGDNANWFSNAKSLLFSVRCVQD